MVLPRDRWARSIILLLMGQCMLVSAVVAETRTTDDYIAITVEAEDHSSVDDRWILTEPSTPAQDNDPDPNHSDGAVGNAYLELLPDMRVTHEDTFGPPTAIWNERGSGPRASYPLNFPEAGRYYVHIRAFSTGTEDNGIHVGLNDDFPLSGARMQFCTAGQGWAWSGRQRDAGGMGPCGAPKTIWVTVEEPGMNTFMISAREDGFEADRIMLIKDLSDNTRICKPTGVDDISCVNGSLENVDDVVDMDLEMETSTTLGNIEEEVDVTIVVRNRDGYDIAKDVMLTLDLELATKWSAMAVDEACEVDGTAIACDLGQVGPSGPEHEKYFEFSIQPLRSGILSIPASIKTSSIDDSPANDEVSVDIDVSDEGTLSQLSPVWAMPASAWEVDSETDLALSVTNTGVADADNADIRVSVPSGLIVSTLPDECTGIRAIQCSFQSLAVGERVDLVFGITPSSAGIYSATVIATAANLDGDDPTESYIIEATDAGQEVAVEVDLTDQGTTEKPDSAPAVSGVPANSGSGSMGLWLFMLLTLSLAGRGWYLLRSRRVSLTVC